MIVYRIVREKYLSDLSGKGAEKYGGRWNSPGLSVIYTASTPSLALLEVLAWTSLRELLAGDFLLLLIAVPKTKSSVILTDDLPEEWHKIHGKNKTQALGDAWLKDNKTLTLRIPSAILPIEDNFLINPSHPLMEKVAIKDVYDINFDPRIIENLTR